LQDNGWIENATLHPPLTEEDVEDISILKNADNMIQRWYEKHR
jgi:4-hydroxy-tetrahydrodipicolinate synthase